MAFQIHLRCLYVTIFIVLFYNINALERVAKSNSESPIRGFSWQNCGPSSDSVQIKSLTLAPDPINLPGNLTYGISVGLLATLPTDIFASVTMEKKVGGFYIKIPCVDNVGSCNYGNLCQAWAEVCPKYFAKYGLPCNCPIPPNAYSIPTTTEYVKANLPSILSGDFRITGDLRSNSGHLGCLQVIVSLK